MLEVKNLSVSYGMIDAVKGIDFEVNDGEIVALIGANGAGKTTVFNLLTKVYEPTRGEIFLDDKNIANLNTEQVNKEGVARTFQNIRLFSNISVIDNVKAAMNNLYKYSVLDALLHKKKYKQNEKLIDEKANELLEIFNLINKKETDK